jgi:hypothetical protein
LEASFVGFSV